MSCILLGDLPFPHAVVTGATGGIGEKIVEGLVKGGVKVTALGRRKEKLLELEQRLSPEKVLGRRVDFSDSQFLAQFQEALQEGEEAFGPCGILVNNAGIAKDQLAVRVRPEDWEETLRLNLTVPFFLAQALMLKMMRQKFGRIINISSIIGAVGNVGQSAYSAAKGGLLTLTKSLAKEGAKSQVLVNNIAPGYIETPMTDQLSAPHKDKILDSIPVRRLGKGVDVAGAVCFLSSSSANYITGQTLHINGGMGMF